MFHHNTARHALTAAAVAVVLLAGATAASAAPLAADPRPTVGEAHSGSYGQLRTIAVLSAERLATADLVAAAKWGTASPIDDPAREQVVLDTVRQQAVEIGADPEATSRIFRDQIEANKVVQRGLHRLWTADPSQAPTWRPDLHEVRKEINRVNSGLVRAIADSATARSAAYCRGLLTVSAVQVRHEKQLDRLHGKALSRAVPSVCEEDAG
ncbi:gamma subclass chorismate mutase AroQ [Streptomyces albipurpureus]|uniref:chorismate mutase n=1 Tax=Streptomyces albipurpureus TaxID=2897419 RepID=A0ABT0UT87_9ACTN|nr:gamma subclass chorismate mutase AroQ [Streptomyces sp. CWNU-1]MCM2391812.1 gamma subclass chorismate mutase AroQ [Streptomyces sp. CWNU-1]